VIATKLESHTGNPTPTTLKNSRSISGNNRLALSPQGSDRSGIKFNANIQTTDKKQIYMALMQPVRAMRNTPSIRSASKEAITPTGASRTNLYMD